MQGLHKNVARVLAATIVFALPGCDKSNDSTPPVPQSAYHIYVAESGLNQVAELDANTGASIGTVAVGKQPQRLNFDFGTNTLWSANTGSNDVSRIDVGSNKVTATIPVGTNPVNLLEYAGRTIFVANRGSNTISVIDIASNKVTNTIATAGPPFTLTTTTSYLVIGETNNTIEFVDLQTLQVVSSATTTSRVAGIGGAPNRIAVITADGTVNVLQSSSGKLPFTQYDTLNVGAGGGLATEGLNEWFVTNQTTKKLIIYAAAATPGNFNLGTFDVGIGPEYAASSAETGYTYVPNAGEDSISVISLLGTKHQVGTWKLAAGAVPYDVAVTDPRAVSPSPSPAPTTTPSPTPTSTPVASTAHLYVANNDGNNFLVYNGPFSASSAPATTVNYAPGIAFGIAATSTTVAVEDGTGTLRFYNTPVTSTPYATAAGPSEPGYLAFDSFGHLFVTTESNAIFVYAPPFSNSSVPVQTITGATQSYGIAFDSSANLYVGNIASAEIDVFAQPYTAAPLKITAPGASAHINGLAVSGGKLYASDATNNVIDVYTLPLSASSTPAFAISGANQRHLAFDGSGNLFVANSSGSVDVYNAPLSSSSTKAYSITSGIAHPLGIAIAP